MRIAIVDDLAPERERLQGQLEWQLRRRKLAGTILQYDSGEAFLKAAAAKPFDVAFLDIYMPGIDGMETARRLRRTDKGCLLIFITTSRDHALEGFQVRATDSVIGYYCALARREDIPFSTQLDLPERMPVNEMDMCLVLSNLLENALEASLRTKPPRRQIRLTAYLHGDGLLLIRVENAYDGPIREKDGIFQSSKRKGAGVGLRSVRHIAEKSGGVSSFSWENGIFQAKIMLCAPEEEQDRGSR